MLVERISPQWQTEPAASTPRVASSMQIYWLEQSQAQVPTGDRWLSSQEALTLAALRFAKRRADWRLGRWTAKRALAACLTLPVDDDALAAIEIRVAASGAPEACLPNCTVPLTISLSHRDGTALCAVALSAIGLGCDLEAIEPRSLAFVEDYFTAPEQALIENASADNRPMLVTLLWSAKESALKAIHQGLREDTRSMEVALVDAVSPDEENFSVPRAIPPDSGAMPVAQPASWRRLRVRCTDGRTSHGRIFQGWWRHADHLVRTIVVDSPASPSLPVL